MNILGRAWELLFAPAEAGRPAPSGTTERRDAGSEWSAMMGGMGGRTNVTPETALLVAAVYSCVRVLAEGVASLPLKLYRRVGEDKQPATEHRLYPILHDMANTELTSFEFRECMMHNMLLWGN